MSTHDMHMIIMLYHNRDMPKNKKQRLPKLVPSSVSCSNSGRHSPSICLRPARRPPRSKPAPAPRRSPPPPLERQPPSPPPPSHPHSGQKRSRSCMSPWRRRNRICLMSCKMRLRSCGGCSANETTRRLLKRYLSFVTVEIVIRIF